MRGLCSAADGGAAHAAEPYEDGGEPGDDVAALLWARSPFVRAGPGLLAGSEPPRSAVGGLALEPGARRL